MEKLHLFLKHKWFDMIKSGEKKEEYRKITDYWEVRIWCNRFNIKEIVFHKAYTNITICKSVESITIDVGKKEWGAEPGELYYVIKLSY